MKHPIIREVYYVARSDGPLECYVASHLRPATSPADAWCSFLDHYECVTTLRTRQDWQRHLPGLKARKFNVSVTPIVDSQVQEIRASRGAKSKK